MDADDIWLPEYLQTIYELIQNYPDAGLYATAYKKRKASGEESAINIQGLPSKEYVGLIPNYFKSVVKGENLVWTSATCIPKKVFIENDIWFPVGEKYGEDQYVWARVALEKKIAYDTKVCAVYSLDSENNTVEATDKLSMPLDIKMQLIIYKKLAYNKEIQKWLERYIEKYILSKIIKNKKNNNIKNIFLILRSYNIPVVSYLKAILLVLLPYCLVEYALKARK